MEAAQVNLSKEDCLANPAYPGCTEFLGGLEAEFTITHAKPLVANSGEKVMIYGENFPEGMLVKVNGQEVSASVLSGTEASFTMPDGLTNGKVDALAQKYDKSKPFLLYAWVDGTYPLITKEPSEVCLGEKYYNADGDILEGAKLCEKAALTCTQDGQVDCLTSDAFKAAKMANFAAANLSAGVTVAGVAGDLDLSHLTPGNVKSSVTIGGVTGIYAPACSSDGDSACLVDGSIYKAAKLSNFTAANIGTGISIAGVTGSGAMEGHVACASDGADSCVVDGTNYKAAKLSNFSATDVKSGVTIAGVGGSIANCAGGDSGCFAEGPTYTAVTSAQLAQANIKSGATIGGVTGNYGPACAADGGTDCVVDGTTYKAAKLSNFAATDVKSGITIAGINGSATLEGHSDCAADGASGCVVDGATYTAAATANLINTNIKTGVTIGGVAGNVTPSPAACSSDGADSCVVDGTNYKAAKLSNFSATDVKSGVTIAGVGGSIANCAGGDSGCFAEGPTYTAVTSAQLAQANIKSGATIGGVTGNYGPACAADGGTDCLVDGTTYTAAATANLINTNIKTGVTIGGVAGNVTPSPAACSSDGADSCVVDGTNYKAAVTVNLSAGNIKSGVTIGGVTGDYPSATNPLTGYDSTVDLTLGNFDVQVKSATNFEWFDQTGVRYVNGGDPDITAANISSGVTIFGTTGTLANSPCTSDGQQNCVTTSQYKSADTTSYTSWDIRKGKTVGGVAGDITFYKNLANTTLFDRASGTGGESGLDIYDTIDDFNNYGTFPTQSPGGWDQATGANWIMDPTNDTNSNTICDGSEECVFKDRITGLMWAKDDGTTRTWEDAITYCATTMNASGGYGGYTGWRLPTQKELMQAYTDGIWSQKAANKLNLTTNYYWSSSTRSDGTSDAWVVLFDFGSTGDRDKTTSYQVSCVRP